MADPFVRLDAVEVGYLGRRVGALALDPIQQIPVFEYYPDWLESSEDLAPLRLARVAGPQTFRDLQHTSFRGAPGLVADSLPGQFADLLTNSWLARHGIQPGQVTVVDRLGYVGHRGMGAITFDPAFGHEGEQPPSVVDLAEAAATARSAIRGTLLADEDGTTLQHLLDTSGSAGGAHAKAAIALGPEGQVLAGHHDAPDGFTHWLLKFDVDRQGAAGQTTGLAQVEYAYHLMARDAGLAMAECRLLEVDGLTHFLTRRFDRPTPTARLHVQSLAAIAHLPPEYAGAHSYEQYLQTCLQLGLGVEDRREAFRRVVFNLAAAVRDDHTKNLAFLYEQGAWRLAPAFDLTFAFIDGGGWIPHHQMSVAGSVTGADRIQLRELAERARVARPDAILDDVAAAVRRWTDHAEAAGVDPARADVIEAELRATALAR